MIIDRDKLKTVWYDDYYGNKYFGSIKDKPKEFRYRNEQTATVSTRTIYQTNDEQINCKHQSKYLRYTFKWLPSKKGRKCLQCGSTQITNKYILKPKNWKWFWPKILKLTWPKIWHESCEKKIVSITARWNEQLVTAMVKSNIYTLTEAILISANACDRCINALAYSFKLEWGCSEGSSEWLKIHAVCEFCKHHEEFDNLIKGK